MTAPEIIRQLVERFDAHNHEYQQHKNETELRREFLDPFFKALGWDVFNEKGYSERFKEVVHEVSVEVEGQAKAADYAFRAGDRLIFFVEAKKPSVKIDSNPEPAFQLRRYGWSARLPVNILTDFEQLAVYDCRVKPDKTDKASLGRIRLYHYSEYIEKWDEIAGVFSREAVLQGAFDQFAESNKGKKGTSEVDDDFLAEIERWRDLLARNMALRNPAIRNERELNYAVQITIDRIIFLRMCEDRGVERYEQLKDAATPPALSGTLPKSAGKKASQQENSADLGRAREGSIYAGLLQLFKQADARYNSGLFHFAEEKGQSSSADTLTPGLTVDDKVLKDIIHNLYYPDSPYAFNYISADILGQVYERFLGKVIRLTAGHQAKVEEKPEVRKAGGVYYTPTYIVDYIVKNTLGKLLDPTPSPSPDGRAPSGEGGRLTPRDIAHIKVLDPACGSGSFLLGAYQYLLDWYLKYYSENNPEQWARGKNPVIYTPLSPTTPLSYGHTPTPLGPPFSGERKGGMQSGGWDLTTAEKKRILLAHIHGVDIDAQAVEVTKLSLLLKVLEGESAQGIGSQLSLLRERALPDLGRNIQCGNSLIGPDYYEGRQLGLGMFDEEEQYRVNAFNWQAAFPQVFMQGGFDVVIGNPPYGAAFSKDISDYLQRQYKTFVWRGESYLVFIEKAHNILKSGGKFGFIVPDTYLNLGFTQSIRDFLLRNAKIHEIVLLPVNVFSTAAVDTTLLFTEKAELVDVLHESQVSIKTFNKKAIINNLETPNRIFNLSTQDWNTKNGFLIQSDSVELSILSHIENEKTTLGDISEMFYGIKVYQVGKGKPPQTEKIRDSKPFTSETQQTKDFLPFYDGKHIGRYQLLWKENNWLHYGPWLAEPRIPKKFEGEKLLIRKIVAGTLIATYVPETSYCNTLLYVVKIFENTNISYKYLLGILNSKLIGWYFRKKFQISADDTFPQILIRDIMQFPIPPQEKAAHERLVGLVEQMLGLHKRQARTPQEQEMLARQVAATDAAIDKLVYGLYGLSEAEIKVVEGR